MAEHKEHEEGFFSKIVDKIHDHDSSSSSDDDKPKSEPSVQQSKINRLFGREQPVHKVLGGGKPADVLLWRNKKLSAGILGGVTAVWFLFEVLEYHLLSFISHALIVSLAVLFLYSKAAMVIHKAPAHIPEVIIPEGPVLQVASALTYEINRGIATLRDIASGRDLKKFLAIIAGLWILAIFGSCCNFLTLFYISFLLLHTLPVLYEKYEDHVDAYGEKGLAEFKKYYVVFEEKVLSKIPRGPLKDKKLA